MGWQYSGFCGQLPTTSMPARSDEESLSRALGALELAMIRQANAADVEAICRIYNPPIYVAPECLSRGTGTSSYEELLRQLRARKFA